MGKAWRLGLDPGKQTGWALFHGVELVRCGAIDNGIVGFTDWWNGDALESIDIDNFTVICERFVPEVGLGGEDQMWAPEIQGAVRYLALTQAFVLILQQRSAKANLFGQNEVGDKGETERREWLARRGLVFETNHAMDAATHVLYERKRTRDLEFWKRYWA